MTRSGFALRGFLLGIAAAALIPSAAAAQVACQPPSAEHAFEELLDLAPDDTPLEDEAWRISDEQDAKGAFESDETIRRIDELARANGYAYNCTDQMYHPVSGPDPRDEDDDYDDTEPPEASGTGPGGAAAPGPGSASSGGSAGEPNEVPGEAAGGAALPAAAPAGGTGGAALPAAAPAGGTGRAVSDGGGGVPSVDDAPEQAADGEAGVVAVSEEADSASSWTVAGIALTVGLAVVVGRRVRLTRRVARTDLA